MTKTSNVTFPLALSPEAAALKPKAQPRAQGDASLPPVPPAAGEAASEVGGPKGPEPTRFGDWERKGRCSDF